MHISKSFYGFKSIALIIIGALVVLLIYPFSFWNSDVTSFYLNVLKPIINLFLVVLLLYTSYWAYKNDRDVFKAWLLISVGMVMYLVANILYFLFENVLYIVSSPSVADVFYLAVYPITIVGLLLFLKKPFKIRYKALLDAFIIMVSLFFIVWFPFVWPAIEPSQPDTLSMIISIIYLFFDLIFLLVVLTLLFNENRKLSELPLVFLSMGMFFQIFGDMVYAYHTFDPSLYYQWIFSLLFDLNLILIALAVMSYLNNVKINISHLLKFYNRLRKDNDWISYLPLILVLLSYSLLILTTPDQALIFGVGIIVVLVIIRETLSLIEIKKAQKTLKNNKKIIKTSLEEKEALLREIHHRVKNNMQIISSILVLQEDYVEDNPKAVNVLKESQTRVLSMALLHELLYQSKDLDHIKLDDYVRNIVSKLYDSYDKENRINLKLYLDDISVNMETAVPLGLIINELVSNSLKYAYPADASGDLLISLKKIDDEIEFIISDEGVGIPEEQVLKQVEPGFGLELVKSLVKQLDATIKLDKNQGTEFKIKFKPLKYKKRI